jgi:hypothetical protein
LGRVQNEHSNSPLCPPIMLPKWATRTESPRLPRPIRVRTLWFSTMHTAYANLDVRPAA